MTKNKITEIICIVDKSGSMHSIKGDAIGGLNSFLDEQRKVEGRANITIALFSDDYELLADGVDLNDFAGLDNDNYKPSGLTALLDAIGKTITNVKDRQELIPVDKDYIVAILTDGHENASVEYNRSAVMNLINEKTESGWQFIYLGANQDAIGEATSLGIKGMYAGNFVAKGDGASTAVLNASAMVTSYRSAGEMMSYVEADALRTGGNE